MAFVLSRHAKEEMARRGIPASLLDEVLRNPQQVVAEYGGKNAYQSQVDLGQGRIYLLRAIVRDDVDPGVVITVYKTSKIAKYWSTP